MKIKPVDRDIRNLFESHFFVIPRFQRPYSWDRENLSDFWNDVCESTDDDYFIGSMVVYRPSPHAVETNVVDGQQRLTTIILLLCAIRDRFNLLSERDLALGLQGLIERPDLDSKKRFTLFSETPYPFLQDHIQKFGSPELKVDIGPEEERLKAAYDDFCARLDSKIKAINVDTALAKGKKIPATVSWLKSLRDRVLRLQAILVELDNEDDAYLIFETLNTRGKDLQPADLVKNHLTRLLKSSNKDNDVTREKWTKIVKTIDGAASDIDMNSFLLHQWLSEREYVAQKKLFKELKFAIGKGQAKSYLATLETEAMHYRSIFEVGYKKWRKDERGIQGSLNALQVFRIRQAVPTILAILCCYADDDLTRAQVEQVLKRLENFHFVFTAVASQRGSGGLASMYSRAARDIRAANGKNGKQQAIKELFAKFKERVPALEEFLIGFQQIKFSDEYTRERALVRYILEKFDQHLAGRAPPVDYEQMTIEHIWPQSKDGIDEDEIAGLGNLIFVPTELNNKDLGAKEFSAKKKILCDNGVPLDGVLQRASRWGADQITERTVALAGMAYEEIWTV